VKILMVCDFYLPQVGGMERAVADLSGALLRRGHGVAVATMWQEGLPRYEELDGVAVHRLRGLAQAAPLLHARPRQRYHPPLPDPLVARGLARLIARERPHIVHGHSWMLLSALPACRTHGVATVVTLHDYALLCPKKTLLYHEARPCPNGLGARCLCCAASMYGRPKAALVSAGLAAGRGDIGRIDRFIAISPYVAATHIRSGVVEAGRVVTVPNFVRDDVLSAPRRPRLPDLPDEYILFVGALGRHKGLPLLLDAYTRLETTLPLVLVGPARPETPSTFPAGVIALGNLPHDGVVAAMDHCRFLVHPALWPEPFGLVLIEAMARGKAVVTSRAGGPLDIVRDGETGLLAPLGDAAALASALRALIDDPELAACMGRAGAAHCAASYSSTVALPRIEEVYAAAYWERQARPAPSSTGSDRCPNVTGKTSIRIRIGNRL